MKRYTLACDTQDPAGPKACMVETPDGSWVSIKDVEVLALKLQTTRTALAAAIETIEKQRATIAGLAPKEAAQPETGDEP